MRNYSLRHGLFSITITILFSLALLPVNGCYLRPKPPSSLRIIFTSDTQGNFTPCGCAGGPRGGFETRATAIAEARATAPGPVILVDTGNFSTGLNTEVELLKTDYVVRGMGQLGYDAVNVGHLDARRARLGVMAFDQPGMPITSAGYTYEDEEAGERLFSYPKRIIVEREGFNIAIVGSPLDDIDPETLGFQNEPTVTGLELMELMNRINTEDGVSMVIMITDNAASWQQARITGSRFALATIIIAGSSAPPEYEEARSVPEIQYPVIVPRAASWGRSLGILDVELSPHGGILGYHLDYVDLDEDVVKAPEFRELTEEYLAALTEAPSGLPEVTHTGYVGSNACKSCHLPEFENWQESRHATAWNTLETSGRLGESTCTPCHTTGLATYELVPQRLVPYELRNVGCESCHGPGDAHIMYQEYVIYGSLVGEVRGEDLEDPIVLTPDEDTCLACHVPPYDEAWMYGLKLNRVMHEH